MGELLSAEEVKSIGLRFIQEKYYRGKVTISETRLVTGGTFPAYHLAGTIKLPSRSIMGRFVSPSDAPYTFSLEVHAQEGSIINYELR